MFDSKRAITPSCIRRLASCSEQFVLAVVQIHLLLQTQT